MRFLDVNRSRSWRTIMTAAIVRSKYRYVGLLLLVLVAGTAAYLLIDHARVEATEPATEQPATAPENEGEDIAPIPVEAAEIELGPVASYITATANLVPEDEVKVLAEAEGRVVRLEVEEGDSVTQGEVLAVIDRDEAEIALNKAALRAANARVAFERAEGTLDQGLISREEFDRLTLEYDVARQEVAEAEWRLQRTVICAPFTGRVTERFITPGQHLRPGDELFTVADFDPLIARIFLPEKDVLTLDEGRVVRISLAADPSLEFVGRIRQISPVVDTATGTVKVTVEASSPPTQARPGAFVSIGIVRERREAAVLLPRKSVIRELRSAHVFITDGAKAEKRSVSLGLEEGDIVEALGGVEAGEQVIVAGQGGLKDGAKVKIL
jgi:membrane fusion protein (multidrug efflux system)